MSEENRLIGERLVEAKLITQEQLEEGLAAQKDSGAKIVACLVGLGHLQPEDFTRYLSQLPGVASIDLTHYEIEPDLVEVIPRDFAVEHEVFPIDKLGKLLTLGMMVPLDKTTIKSLEEETGLRIKPLLCSGADITEAIDRYYKPEKCGVSKSGMPTIENIEGLRAPIKLAGVANLIQRVDSLPALPETVGRVRDAMDNPRSSIGDVAQIITMDPPIAAKVLSVANSAAYGFPNRVDDITLAVSLLGLRETYSIVLAAAVLDLAEKSKSLDYKQFWLRSMACAAAARMIARACGRKDKAGVFAAGLLHGIGRVALAEVSPDGYSKVDAKLSGAALMQEEESILGINHAEAGYQLAEHWKLPDDIAEAIRFHHNPGQAPKENELVPMVALAVIIASAQGKNAEENQGLFGTCGDTMTSLGLTDDIASAILDEFLSNRNEALGNPLN
jgi:putative nucleotidyltransferase with HDIG domain